MSTENNTSQRNMGIELLRIVAMFSIIVLHVLGQGGVLNKAPALSKNYEAAWFLEILCYYGVPAYAIITGYVSNKAKFYATNLVYLWLQVFFYNILAIVIFLALGIGSIGPMISMTIFPISQECYWYFTAYAGAFFFIPAIKLVIEKLDKPYHDLLFYAIIIFWSVATIVPGNNAIVAWNGASFAWILACIYIGAYMSKYQIFMKLSKAMLFTIYIVSMIITFASKYLIEVIYGAPNWHIDRGNILISYNSPTVLLASMAMVVLFSKIDVNNGVKKVVRLVAPLTFGVYLSNCQPMVFTYLMAGRFNEYTTYPVWKLLICTICSALVIFLIGIAIDAIRKFIFDIFNLKGRLHAFEKYVLMCYTKKS